MKYYPSYFDNYTINDKVPCDTPIWACMYNHWGDLKPILGKIIKLNNIDFLDNINKKPIPFYFIPYKNNNQKLDFNNVMNANGKTYSHTYEESVEIYNNYIEDRIALTTAKINKLEIEINNLGITIQNLKGDKI